MGVLCCAVAKMNPAKVRIDRSTNDGKVFVQNASPGQHILTKIAQGRIDPRIAGPMRRLIDRVQLERKTLRRLTKTNDLAAAGLRAVDTLAAVSRIVDVARLEPVERAHQ